MTQPDLHTVALSILRAPGWSRVGITAPSSRLREAAASEMAEKIIEALEHPERNQDHRQIALPFDRRLATLAFKHNRVAPRSSGRGSNMDIFKAGVQYDDFSGSVAADQADNSSLLKYLQEQGIAGSNEQLAGIRIGFGENDSKDVDEVDLVSYLYEADKFDPKPVKIRAVGHMIAPSKLFSFYKRFDLVMTRKDIDLGSSEVGGPHY